MPSQRQSWPVIAALIIFWLTVALTGIFSARENQGHFVYALDDAYIHMAIAKNFVNSGSWATSGETFSSDSSSPLWTGLLAFCYLIAGTNELLPFILNVFLGTLLLIMCSIKLGESQVFGAINFVCLLFLIFAVPLPALVFVGMEHILHICVTVLYCFTVGKVLSDDNKKRNEATTLYFLSAVIVLCRYEGLFLVMVTSILFALKKRFRESFLSAILGLIPITSYGVFSLYCGNDFLPNSINLKGHFPQSLGAIPILKFIHAAIVQISTSHMLVVIATCLFFIIIQSSAGNASWSEARVLCIVFVSTALLHLSFADVGWLYRYEAYLVALGIMVIFVSGTDLNITRPLAGIYAQDRLGFLAVIVLGAVLSSPFVGRAADALWRVPSATHNIYVQQYQAARFLNRYYPGQSVAVNDLGAISFFANVRCIDLWGVGNVEVARVRKQARKSGYNDTQIILDLLQRNKTDIAIIYESLFSELGLPAAGWKLVGQWRMLCKNVICASDTVSFYARTEVARTILRNNLADFDKFLPADVEQKTIHVGHNQKP